MQRITSRFGLLLLGWTLLCVAHVCAVGQSRPADYDLRADASMPVAPMQPAEYDGGTSRSPDGQVIGVTNRYLTLGGRPWIPVIGEMHYGRVPEADWDKELAEMKAAGVDVVSTYVIWIYHEEVQGKWDWSGDRDLRRFAALCHKHGLLLMVRIGPWAHAETRNGGLPDWVMHAGPTRQMNPIFLKETREFYNQIGMQLQGLLWKDGGPVIGVQIENEYGQRGPGKGEAYILALKAMAREAGLDVPLYTVTGWDSAVIPRREFLPVYGGYPAAPWSGSTAQLGPQEVYAFRFGSRVSGNMGMIGAKEANGREHAQPNAAATPFLTAEVGGGIEDTYHRRPSISADDIAAMVPVMLGSGVNGYGTYMMVGGEDPLGKLTTLQESQATGYPTDVPVKSYDFQAPISEFGQERRSLRLLKEWNYFMRDFGAELAPMPAFAPSMLPRDPADLSVLRWSVRTDGKAGFIFVNNYVRGVAMAPRDGVRFTVALPGGRTVQLPDQPIDIPSGAFFAWPFSRALGDGLELRYATAQLMTRLAANPQSVSTDVFFCVRDVRCEISLRGRGLHVQAPKGIQLRQTADGALLTRESNAGALSVISVRVENAGPSLPGAETTPTTQLVLLSPEAAQATWKLPLGDEEHLVSTRADIWADADGLTTEQLGDPHFQLSVYPRVKALATTGGPLKAQQDGEFNAVVPEVQLRATLQQESPGGTVPPVHLGPPLPWRPAGVAEAPDDAVWAADAARWRIHMEPATLPSGVSDIFLSCEYVGDEARLIGSGGALFEDNFWNGEPWLVGLHRFSSANGTFPNLQLQVLPIRADAPIYLDASARSALSEHDQTLVLKAVDVIPQYELHITTTKADAVP